MRRPGRTSWRTLRNMAFIRSAMLSYWIFLTLLSPLSFGLGARNLYVRDPWGVPSCYTGVLLQYTRYRYLCTSVCHYIWVAYLDYPYDCLWIVSRDELLSHFNETPSIWGGKQNTPYSGFAKSLRFLNMVMTFTLTPLSHYNSIIEPWARFLLSILEDLSINFPSHFITFVIIVYQDMANCVNLSFL